MDEALAEFLRHFAGRRLEDDPVYQRHPQDWREYHTRYVSPRSFHDALSRTGF
jgi:hypothetical protein